MALPDRERLAFHEAGHAVVQHWVARGGFQVTLVALDTDGGRTAGCSLIDQDVQLNLYEFGLVTLAGIAAEERYFREHAPPAGADQWGAVGDIEEWLETAHRLLGNDGRVEMVTRSLQEKLQDFFEHDRYWGIVSELAAALVVEGAVEGERLQKILNGEGRA